MTTESRLLKRIEALEAQIRELNHTLPPVEKAPVEGEKVARTAKFKMALEGGEEFLKEYRCLMNKTLTSAPKEEIASPLAEKIYPYVSNDHLSVVMLLINEAIYKARLDERKRLSTMFWSKMNSINMTTAQYGILWDFKKYLFPECDACTAPEIQNG